MTDREVLEADEDEKSNFLKESPDANAACVARHLAEVTGRDYVKGLCMCICSGALADIGRRERSLDLCTKAPSPNWTWRFAATS